MSRTPTPVTSDDLPLLGEPLPIEFANTAYGSNEDRVGFLLDAELVRLWFGSVATAPRLPARLRAADVTAIQELRDATRAVLCALVDGVDVPERPVVTLNAHAARAPQVAFLAPRQAGFGGLSVGARTEATGLDTVLGALANATIALVASDVARLRRCDSADCMMLFVQQHRRRRWCHPSCGHRAHQANYYRRRRSAGSR